MYRLWSEIAPKIKELYPKNTPCQLIKMIKWGQIESFARYLSNIAAPSPFWAHLARSDEGIKHKTTIFSFYHKIVYNFKINCTFVAIDITQGRGNLPIHDRHFLCLLSPYGGSCTPVRSVNAPSALAVSINGTGGTVSFRPNLDTKRLMRVNRDHVFVRRIADPASMFL